jgi:hypothetical protein
MSTKAKILTDRDVVAYVTEHMLRSSTLCRILPTIASLRRLGRGAVNDHATHVAYDDRVIELENPHEVAYWLKFLATTKDELFAAISEVGPLAQRVRQHLKEKALRAR